MGFGEESEVSNSSLVFCPQSIILLFSGCLKRRYFKQNGVCFLYGPCLNSKPECLQIKEWGGGRGSTRITPVFNWWKVVAAKGLCCWTTLASRLAKEIKHTFIVKGKQNWYIKMSACDVCMSVKIIQVRVV